MAIYDEFLYDYLGNEYKRKNLYLLEIAKLQNKIREAKVEEKAELKSELKKLIKNKDKHPYNKGLNEFRKKEKLFLKSLKSKKRDYYNSLNRNMTLKIRSLKAKLLESREKYEFYKEYVNLCYDAELAYEENKLIKNQLPEIIDFLENNQLELIEALNIRKKLNKEEENKAKVRLKNLKVEQKKALVEGRNQLKKKRKEHVISEKAEVNGIAELKQKNKKSLSLLAYELPSKANKELIKNKRYDIKNGYRRMLTVLKANLVDIKRKVPVESTKSVPVYAFLTFLIPGLGQILNKQYEKGIMFFLISLFTYLIAIPYALGYGNYQGDGISGLISLAQGGAKVDKSLIFMIEGILAILLLVVAAMLMYASFRDVLKVEKDKIKGIRERNWFETRTNLKQDGFPYVVSSPAFFIMIFIILVPVITTILLSFTGMDPKHQSKFGWIGLGNYELIALGKGLAGSTFWLILGWTIIWTLTATTLAILIGFILALLANNERVKFKGFFRTVYLLPWAVPSFITIMFFSIMFSPNGALTEIISFITGNSIEVKNDTNLTRIVLIFLQGWLGSAYVFVLTTGVLQAIPKDLYEAADIDGATRWQKTRRITIPLVLFQIAPLLVTQYTFNFNNFSIIHLFNGGGPFNPNLYGNLAGSSDLLISYIYKLTIMNQYQAIGAAITTVISLGLMFFAFLGFKNTKGFKEERL